MKIAFLLPHLRAGGAERVVVNLLRALDRERFELFLMLGRAEGDFLELVPGDVPVVDLGGRRARRLPRRIAGELDARGIDVACSATAAMNVALLASRWWGGRRTRRIVSEHTTPAEHIAEAKQPLLRRLLMRHLYPRADAVAVPTDAIGQELRRVLRRPGLRTVTLPNPVVERVAPARSPRTGRPELVSAGRLVEAKGYDVLLEAAALLAGRGTDFGLTIYGEGLLRPELERRIAGLAGCVRLAGHSADLAPAFAAADLFVLASRREGFGNVIVEAMAAGLPVLATRCGGPASLIDDGVNGFLVPPEDSEALAGAIAALLSDRARRESVVPAGLETAARYAVGPAAKAFEALAERLSGNPAAGDHPDAGQPHD